MRLHVSLGYDIESILVAQRIPPWIVRIMGSAHGINVAALHKENVGKHLLLRYGTPIGDRVLMTVHPFELDRLTIEENPMPLDFHAPESDLHASAVYRIREFEPVEIGRLSAPQMHISNRQPPFTIPESKISHTSAIGVEENGTFNVVAGDAEHTRPEVVGDIRVHAKIAYRMLWFGI
jgi:hypothetical protein